MVAPNGARRAKSDHPALPLTIEEIAASAAACHEAGASSLHLHVRDEDGNHSLDHGRYREAIAAIAEVAPMMKVQVSTESAGQYSPEDQLFLLERLRPAWASAAVRELAADEAVARNFYSTAQEDGVRLQHILYDVKSIEQFTDYAKRGIVDLENSEVLFVLGRYDPPSTGSPEDLRLLLAYLDRPFLEWSVCAFGPREQTCLLRAVTQGGHPRVGFENNLVCPHGTPWRDNAEAVASLVSAIDEAALMTGT